MGNTSSKGPFSTAMLDYRSVSPRISSPFTPTPTCPKLARSMERHGVIFVNQNCSSEVASSPMFQMKTWKCFEWNSSLSIIHKLLRCISPQETISHRLCEISCWPILLVLIELQVNFWDAISLFHIVFHLLTTAGDLLVLHGQISMFSAIPKLRSRVWIRYVFGCRKQSYRTKKHLKVLV